MTKNPNDTSAVINPKDLAAQAKPGLGIIPLYPLMQLSCALTEGARKYGLWNWRRQRVQYSVYLGAAMRHLMQCYAGQMMDRDSLLSHITKASAGLVILEDAIRHNVAVDDRMVQDVDWEELREHIEMLFGRYTDPKDPPPSEGWETVDSLDNIDKDDLGRTVKCINGDLFIVNTLGRSFFTTNAGSYAFDGTPAVLKSEYTGIAAKFKIVQVRRPLDRSFKVDEDSFVENEADFKLPSYDRLAPRLPAPKSAPRFNLVKDLTGKKVTFDNGMTWTVSRFDPNDLTHRADSDDGDHWVWFNSKGECSQQFQRMPKMTPAPQRITGVRVECEPMSQDELDECHQEEAENAADSVGSVEIVEELCSTNAPPAYEIKDLPKSLALSQFLDRYVESQSTIQRLAQERSLLLEKIDSLENQMVEEGERDI